MMLCYILTSLTSVTITLAKPTLVIRLRPSIDRDRKMSIIRATTSRPIRHYQTAYGPATAMVISCDQNMRLGHLFSWEYSFSTNPCDFTYLMKNHCRLALSSSLLALCDYVGVDAIRDKGKMGESKSGSDGVRDLTGLCNAAA